MQTILLTWVTNIFQAIQDKLASSCRTQKQPKQVPTEQKGRTQQKQKQVTAQKKVQETSSHQNIRIKRASQLRSKLQSMVG